MTLNVNQFLLDLRDSWLIPATGLAVDRIIKADQNSPAPERPYITMKVTSILPVNVDETRSSFDENEDRSLNVGTRQINIDINCIGDNSLSILCDAAMHIGHATVQDSLLNEGISVLSLGSASDVTALLETHFEERAFLEGFFAVSLCEFAPESDTIESVGLNGHLNDDCSDEQSEDRATINKIVEVQP